MQGLRTSTNELDDINDARDEVRITTDPEFIGWYLVGGIRFGKPVAVRDMDGAPFLKIMVAPLTASYQTDFDVFPLAVKRSRDGALQKVVVDFTKTVNYE